MAQNNGNFSMEDAKRIAQSKAGQQLLALLQSQDPKNMQIAMKQASMGDLEQLKKTLTSFMATPEAQSLIKQLEKKCNE